MLGHGLNLWLPNRGGFSPATLFAASEPGVWFDPSDLSTLFQDDAGTTPVTAAGQPVGRILDRSGRGNHATQATAASRPLYQVDSGGRGYLLFDGVDDFIVTPTITPNADKVQVFAGVQTVVAQTGLVVGSGASDSGISGGFSLINSGSGTAFQASTHGGTAVASRAVGSLTGVRYVFGLLFDHAQSGVANEITYRRNGTLPATSDAGVDAGAGNYAANPLFIGRRGGTSLSFNGRLYGLITRFGPNLTADQTTQSERWMAQRTGVSL